MYKNVCTNEFHDKGLGGILESYPTEIGPWDITVKEGFRIELDEEKRFNRYRSITLDSNGYQRSECFSQQQFMQYKKYCKVYEDSCPHNGGWWSSKGANRQFGLASSPGDFYGNGSS